jgi:hypothetical protein
MTHIALLGGTRNPNVRTSVALIGGINADLRETTLAPETTITKVSFVGGVNLRLPENARVEVQRFWLFGGKNIDRPAGDPNGPLVTVRAFGIVGGVHVQ